MLWFIREESSTSSMGMIFIREESFASLLRIVFLMCLILCGRVFYFLTKDGVLDVLDLLGRYSLGKNLLLPY